MRSGASTVHQTLTTEAASVLKHSLSLARRRGHAQVTPLHVAATLLSSRASLLRRACLKSHQPFSNNNNNNQNNNLHHHHQSSSHPLQCRALELCFNVALNRLPTTPGPLLHGQPSLSNALIAALKRAQAHQRRGCIEQQQQQPLLTIKVELEQLIISILDDPSVSRVMREAGFSSTNVKNNIEDYSSVFQCYNTNSTHGGVFSSPSSPSHENIINPTHNNSNFWGTHFLNYSSSDHQNHPSLYFSPPQKRSLLSSVKEEDMKMVFEVLSKKKKMINNHNHNHNNTVIVGDCVSMTEGLVAEVMNRVERGDHQVPDELKQTHFIKFQFAPVALRFMKKDDIETNIEELKRKVGSFNGGGGGVFVYTGDLKWTVENHQHHHHHHQGLSTNVEYNPVDHLVGEIGKLVNEYKSLNAKVWFLATASYQTYMRCQMRQPSLEIQWGLQAVSVPSGGLGLSLHANSSGQDSRSHKPSQAQDLMSFSSKEGGDKLTCCVECTSNYEKEAQPLKTDQQKLLPSWLQSHNTNQKDDLVELRKKWNRFCHSLHQGRHNNQTQSGSNLYNNQSLVGKSYSSYGGSFPWWPNHNTIFSDSASISFGDSMLRSNVSPKSVPKFRRQNSCTIEFNFGNNANHKSQPCEPSLESLNGVEDKEVKITLALGSDGGEPDEAKYDTTMQVGNLSRLLHENVPWQCEAIMPSMVEALVADFQSSKRDSWVLVRGNDTIGKRRLARVVAESLLGSADFVLEMNMRRKDRHGEESNFCKVLENGLRSFEKVVVLVESIDFADTKFMNFLYDGFKSGKFGEFSRKDGKSIFILTKGDSSRNIDDDKKMQTLAIDMTLKVMDDQKNSSFGKSNFDHKRKVEWGISSKVKSHKTEENEDHDHYLGVKKDFSRQSSFNNLDLNMKADENEDEDEDEEKGMELKPNDQSKFGLDLRGGTHETENDPRLPNGFLDLIKNRFVLDRNPVEEKEIKDVFSTKIRGSLEDVVVNSMGGHMVRFSVEDRLLGEIGFGCGYFLNGLFEKWLKEVFQTRLKTGIKNGGKQVHVVRLCLGGGDGIDEKTVFEDNRFMGTCLPKNIQVSFMDS